jgi:hypothetical protein
MALLGEFFLRESKTSEKLVLYPNVVLSPM